MRLIRIENAGKTQVLITSLTDTNNLSDNHPHPHSNLSEGG
jgi:hypothetical protein